MAAGMKAKESNMDKIRGFGGITPLPWKAERQGIADLFIVNGDECSSGAASYCAPIWIYRLPVQNEKDAS